LVLFQVGNADAFVTGAVRSILTGGALVAFVVLPALSETEALAVRFVPSPPRTLSAGHEPLIPESPSEQVQCTVTFALYHPFAFALVVGAPVSDGAVLSMLIPVTLAAAVLPALSSALPDTD
jgi:hypothetical protein